MVATTSTIDGTVDELEFASLGRLLFLRATFRPVERDHPYALAVIKQLARRTAGARAHRCRCLLASGEMCGMSFHTFLDQGGLANVSRSQQERIAAAARRYLPTEFALEFCIEPRPAPAHWYYVAFCSGDAFAHRILIVTRPLAEPVERTCRSNFENDDDSRAATPPHRPVLKRKLDEDSWPLAAIRKALRVANS